MGLKMDISTEINKKKNMRWHIVKGAIDLRELTDYLKEIYNSPDFDSEMNVFWDLQEADFSCVASEDIRSFRDYVYKQWGVGGKSKAALIVSRTSDYGVSRMYQIMMENVTSSKIAVFRDRNEAKEWIEAET